VRDSLAVTRPVRAAFTLEQCWHEVPGGTARAAVEAARALAARADVELVGVAARHRHPAGPEWQVPIPIRMLPLPRLLLYESWHYLRWPPVTRATGAVDLVHATGLAVPPKSAPLVVTIFDLAFLHEPTHFTKHGLRFFHRSLDLIRREADAVIVPSRVSFDDCVDHGLDPAKLRLVPLGVDQRRATVEQVDRVRRRYGLDRPYVLWVGTVEPRKNLPVLIRAFAAADPPQTDLVLVGPRGWNEDLSRWVEPLAERVKVIGFVDRDDLAPLYAGARALCLPSIREGFGLPVLEAMVQATPVVTSAGTSTAEVAGEAALLVDPTDVSEVADALQQVVVDDGLAEELAEQGRERARGFTWERTADLLAEVYFEVAR
jgi:glycosyltransferase involved in cell wall biosynthesis